MVIAVSGSVFTGSDFVSLAVYHCFRPYFSVGSDFDSAVSNCVEMAVSSNPGVASDFKFSSSINSESGIYFCCWVDFDSH